MTKIKTKVVTVRAQQQGNAKGYFEAYLMEYHKKQAATDSPVGPWRSDTEFGMLLGIRSATQILLGNDHPLSLWMEEQIQALVATPKEEVPR